MLWRSCFLHLFSPDLSLLFPVECLCSWLLQPSFTHFPRKSFLDLSESQDCGNWASDYTPKEFKFYHYLTKSLFWLGYLTSAWKNISACQKHPWSTSLYVCSCSWCGLLCVILSVLGCPVTLLAMSSCVWFIGYTLISTLGAARLIFPRYPGKSWTTSKTIKRVRE